MPLLPQAATSEPLKPHPFPKHPHHEQEVFTATNSLGPLSCTTNTPTQDNPNP